jgi:DNA-binding NtrC family response regulator
MERNLILKTLQQTGYNKKKAAELLNMSRKTLYNKLEKYAINTPK